MYSKKNDLLNKEINKLNKMSGNDVSFSVDVNTSASTPIILPTISTNNNIEKRIIENVIISDNMVDEMMDDFNNEAKIFSRDGSFTITIDEFIEKIKKEYEIEFIRNEYGLSVKSIPECKNKEKYIQELEYHVNQFIHDNIDYPEYLRFTHEYIIRNEENEEMLRNIFLEFSNGQHLKNPKKLLKMLDTKITENEINDLIKKCDVDNDGKINYPEFIYLIMSINK